MKNKKNPSSHAGFFLSVFLLLLSSALFWLSNPNIIFENGLGWLAYFYYIPVLFLVKKLNIKKTILSGAFYGIISYGLLGYWLNSFHPLGLLVVCIGYMIICAILFLVLKWADSVCCKNGWLLQFFCLCAYEYIKTLGFFGISYGVSAYTQWRFIYLIQISSLIGVFGLNFLVIFPSSFFYSLISKNREKKRLYNHIDFDKKSHISAYVTKEKELAVNSLTLTYVCGFIWLLLFFSSILFGYKKISQKNQNEYVTIAAIQNNESPWKNGIEEYSRNVNKLIQLTKEAQSLSPDIDIIVWPETAVVPSIVYNYDYGTDIRRFSLISQLLNFIDDNNAVFVIGNAHQVEFPGAEKKDYNSALVFESGKNVHPPEPEIYSKMKLVPFTESFPMKHTFPYLYIKLVNGGGHMWEKGDEYTVFNYRGLSFSTPICFEDQFTSNCRNMVLNGARCFINLSNDSWSNSIPCQRQHLAMAVFRSVENQVPSVRSTVSGVTCIINPDGRIEKAAPEFCDAFIIGKVPLINKEETTLYTRFGDLAGMAAFLLSSLILIIQTFIVIIRKIRK